MKRREGHAPSDASVLDRLRRREVQQALHSTTALLVLITLAFSVVITLSSGLIPVFLLTLPLMVASLVLGPRQLPWFVVLVMVLTTFIFVVQGTEGARGVARIVTMFGLGAIVLVASLRRSSLGVDGLTGESMLVDLRDRILKQGLIPTLPSGWSAVSALQSAGGTPFAGDFVVASRDPSTGRFDVALVDVSGKGEDAGTRALLLSGAFGGLLAALDPQDFLATANDYLLRQDWLEGFATAIHLSVDITTDEFQLRSAGHPPAALYDCAAGTWSLMETEGPVLGLMPDAEFTVCTGRLQAGDALMLFTDGMVESRHLDLDLGIARLLEQAEPALSTTVTSEALRLLVETVGSTDDDRAMVVVQRH